MVKVLLLVLLSHLACIPAVPSLGSEAEAWAVFDDEGTNFTKAVAAAKVLRDLHADSNDSVLKDKFKRIVDKISVIFNRELRTAAKFYESARYTEAAGIVSALLEYDIGLLDQKARQVCKAQLISYRYREALIGKYDWGQLVDDISRAEKNGQVDTDFSYHKDMGLANQRNKQAELENPEMLRYFQTPTGQSAYVLRFEMPQFGQTPSLAHFGHAMFDGLWPFVLAYSRGEFARCSNGAAVYVLDIGLYILPLLRTVFPAIKFIPFHGIDELPHVYELVTLRGPGMARFGTVTNPFHIAFGGNEGMRRIREVILEQLDLTPKGNCIVLLSRQMDQRNLKNFHVKSQLDRSREAPFLRFFHDAGENVYTAMYYGETTGHERRTILNEKELFAQMRKAFNKKYGMCVKLVQLDKLSIMEQFETFASAKLVIGQHGAGLAYASFLPNSAEDNGITLELNPQINPNFHLACQGTGVHHRFLDRTQYGDVYATEEDSFIKVFGKRLVKVMMSFLVGWVPPQAGGVLDLSATSLSPAALAERNSIESFILAIKPGTSAESVCVENAAAELSVPEVPYIRKLLGLGMPFVWVDSGCDGVFAEEDGGSLPWAHAGRAAWEESMRRVVYDQQLTMPQKVMASPSNVFDFYDTFTYDVINLNPGEFPPIVSVQAASVKQYERVQGPFEPNTLRFIHFSNRTIVDNVDNFVPLQRQVTGPGDFPDIGFRMMDATDPRNFSYEHPVVASGEKYYIRLSAERGKTFYDIYAPFLFPAAFNKFRDIRSEGSAKSTPGGDGDLKSYRKSSFSYANPRTRHDIVSPVERMSVYFSSKGAVTNLHYDESGEGTVVCQLKGSKRFQLWPPGGHDVMKTHLPQSHPRYRRSRFDGRSPARESHALAMRRTHDITISEGMCIFFPGITAARLLNNYIWCTLYHQYGSFDWRPPRL